MRRAGVFLVAVLAVAWAGLPAQAQSGKIILASTSDVGVKGNDWSTGPHLSADGTKAAFSSLATNIDPADLDGLRDIYVKDLTTGDIVLASTSDSGVKGNFESVGFSLAADGTRVAFHSKATNLDPADRDSIEDVYVKDLTTGDIFLASTSDSGVKGNGISNRASLAPDGMHVAFDSGATNLDPVDTDLHPDIYVKDLASNDLTLASTSALGVKGNGASYGPVVSAGGTRVAFQSNASNLHPADTDTNVDIYVKDLTTGSIVLACTSDAGIKANTHCFSPSLSADGTRVAFFTGARNLDPADRDGLFDIYVKDLTSGNLTLASTSSTGMKGNGTSTTATLSADGSRVAFESGATNLHPDDADTIGDVFVKDLATGKLALASTSALGVKGNDSSHPGSLSADGRRVGFYTAATNLVPADTDDLFDVYVKRAAAHGT